MKWILTILALVVAASVAVAQWPKAVGSPVNAIHHEPMPRKDGLRAAGSDAPVILLEEDEAAAPIATPAKDPNSDDLLYRTSPIGAPEHPDSVHNVAREVRPDRNTGREPWLTYHTVFDPAVIPFKRNSVKDKVNSSGALVVDNTQLWELPVTGNTISNGRETFLGSILVDLRAGFHVPIPSVSPESRILSYVSTPPVKLVFHKDSADNLYVSAKEHSGRLRLKMVMDAPSHWFGRPIPAGIRMDQIPIRLRKRLPENLQREARLVRNRLGLDNNGDFGRSLSKLVNWFRSFKAGELPKSSKRSLYLNIALSQRGICRHRAWAFTITAQSMGIPSRYVQNEAHAFVEVWIPESGNSPAGWLRIDLGGGAQGMNVRSAQERTRHRMAASDPFGFPKGFRSGYSQRANTEDGGALTKNSEPVNGLPPVATSPTNGNITSSNGTANHGVLGLGGDRPQGDGREITRTQLKRLSAQVFRGDKVKIVGHVFATGSPVSDGIVRVLLLDLQKKRVIRVLGKIATDSNGKFAGELVMPKALSPGQWQVVAQYLGSQSHAPSVSE